MNSKVKKGLKFSGIGVGSVVGFVSLIIGITALMPRISYSKYLSNSKRMFKVPGISKNYIAQGLDYVESDGIYLYSGYNKDHKKSSAIYTISKDYKKVKEVKLLNEDGTPYTSHVGGVAAYGSYVYISNNHKFDVFSYQELIDCEKGGTITKKGVVATQNNSSYAYIDPSTNIIYAGEFEKKGTVYTTLESHHIQTNAGDKNTALAIGYRLDTTYEFGIDPTPVEAISLPSLAQGMCFTDNYAVLSTSWGLSTSRLYFYDLNKLTSEGNITLEGSSYTVPYSVFDSSTLVKTVKAPPMSEELDYVDGMVVSISESASNKYYFGKWTGGYYARGYYSE